MSQNRSNGNLFPTSRPAVGHRFTFIGRGVRGPGPALRTLGATVVAAAILVIGAFGDHQVASGNPAQASPLCAICWSAS